VAAFEGEHLGVAGVVARLFDLLEDGLALVGVAGLLQSGELLGEARTGAANKLLLAVAVLPLPAPCKQILHAS
jgi:hypothetical protein